MSIKRTIIVTAAIVASVAMVAPTFAGAVTVAELQAQVNALLAQLQTLQGSATAGTGACVGVTFTRNLTVGSTGSDVKCLQSILNQSTTTRVAATGAGSPGSETTTFGPKTLAAVRIYQAEHGWTPANQVGPMTRAALNAALSVVVTPGPGPVVVPTGAGLSVMLASNNPASGSVILLQGLAPLAKFTFVNGDNAEVKITNLKVNRIGLSLDTSLTNVYLFNGAVRLTDAASVSSGLITFNDAAGLFTVPAGGSTTITVAADLNATAGQTLGVAINASTSVVTNASSVKGTFPINGNLMTAATATGAGVEFAATTTPSTNTSLTPQNDYVVWQNSVVITTRAVDFTRIAFREIGSVKTTDLQNFRLYVDGVQVGSATANLNANGYVTFDLSASPKRLEAGTRVIKLMADVIAGSSLNFKFRVSVSADANFVDTQYNVNTTPTTATTSGSFTVADVTAGVQTIASGTLTFTKQSTSPSGNIVNTASNATLAKYTLVAAGEKVKVESLYVRIIFTNVTGTDDCTASSTVCTTAASMLLRNGMLLANGVQIGSTTAISPVAAGTLFSLGSSLIVEPGSPVTLEVKGDIYDATGTYNDIDSTDTLQARIVAGSSNAQGLVSLATISTPSASTDGNVLTVATGALVLSKYTAYTNQNAVAPLTAYKLAHFTLSAATTESVNINAIYVYLNYVSGNTTNLYVKYGTNTTSVKSSPTSGTSRSADSWSVNQSLAPGQTIDVTVYGDINSSASGVATTGVYVTGTTASSATAVTGGTIDDATTGQTITFTTGSLASAVDGGTPLNQIVAGAQTVTAAKFKLTASNDSYTVTEVQFTVANAATSAVITSLTLSDGTSSVTVPYDNVNAIFNITGLSVLIPANTSKVITIDLNLVTPYTDGTVITTGKNTAVTMSYLKIMNSQGTITTPTTSKVGNEVYVFKTIPTFTLGGTTTSAATITAQNPSAGGTLPMYSFTAAADSKGSVALKQLKFTSTITDATGSSNPLINTLKFFRGSTDLTSSVTIQNSTSGSLESTTANVSGASQTIIVTFDTEESVPAGSSYNYVLKGNFSSFAYSTSGGDALSVSMPTDSTPANASAGAAHTNFYTYNASANTGIQTLATSVAGANGTAANVIWSDNSAQSHAYTYNASSADWFNGYEVLNLPLDSIGQSAK